MKKTLAVAVLSAFLGSAATYAVAAEKQPHMHEAVKHLEQAIASLKKATADKGGHRAKAIGLAEEAIKEVREGIEYDNKH